MSPLYDILGVGCAAVDDLLYVDAYPPPDAKTRVLRRLRACGGLTATALVAAARLGSRCAYAGVLGDNELSRFVRDTFQRERVDFDTVLFHPQAAPVASTIIVDSQRGTRNIFLDPSGLLEPADDSALPQLAVLARVLFIDHTTPTRSLRAAQAASAAGIPIVADLENAESPQFPALLALVDHPILSQGFAGMITQQSDPAAMTRALWSPGRQAVVVTCGERGAWYYSGTGQPTLQPAFPVTVVDTTGCGDVFHGAYASALARGLDLPARVRFAAAAAALKATQPGGQSGIPDLPSVERFLSTAAS